MIWNQIRKWWNPAAAPEVDWEARRETLLARAPIPVFWLMGKTQSGKSSIVKFLTGAEQAEIGRGFRPQTQTSSLFDFPDPEEPIVRFLDTRGLGEAGYNPQEDLAAFNDQAHVVIVTVRLVDQALEEVLKHLRILRVARATRPIVLAVTCLHEAYPGEQHPAPDPYPLDPLASGWPESLNEDVRRLLVGHQQRFAGLVDRIVPVDLTRAEEGFAEVNFGGHRLEETLIELLPVACRQSLSQLRDGLEVLRSDLARKAWPHILGASTLAATAAAVPVPWVDIPAVLAAQSHMVYRIGALYGQSPDRDMVLKLTTAFGARMLSRLALRAPLKAIPFVGMTANAALTFGYTYALGMACCWYFGKVRQGYVPSQEELNEVWSSQLAEATRRWRTERRLVPRDPAIE